MRALAEDLGCSAMTPYRYFHDKQEILAAVRAAAFDRFADAMEKAANVRAMPSPRRVRSEKPTSALRCATSRRTA